MVSPLALIDPLTAQLRGVAEPLGVHARAGVFGDLEPQHRPRPHRVCQPGHGAHRAVPVGDRMANRGADEWLAVMTDPLLSQAAVDRLTFTAHELVIEGQSYRRRQKLAIDTNPQ